jgi:hypothetical protein
MQENSEDHRDGIKQHSHIIGTSTNGHAMLQRRAIQCDFDGGLAILTIQAMAGKFLKLFQYVTILSRLSIIKTISAAAR